MTCGDIGQKKKKSNLHHTVRETYVLAGSVIFSPHSPRECSGTILTRCNSIAFSWVRTLKCFLFTFDAVWRGAVRGGGLSVMKRSHTGMRDESASTIFGYLRWKPTILFKSSSERKYTNEGSENIGNILPTTVNYMCNSL